MSDLYLVLGGVSSGTRLVTRLLLATGLAGDGNHEQAFDFGFPKNNKSIVWRRSYPHGKPQSPDRWPDAIEMVNRAEKAGYTLKQIIVTHRDWYAASASAERRRASIANKKEAIKYNRKAYLMIYSQINDLVELTGKQDIYTCCSYDNLVAYPELYSDWFIKHLNLKWVKKPEDIFNSNYRFYKELKNDKE